MSRYQVGSLFAGVGGVCQAFKNSSCNITCVNEIDINACVTYRLNYKNTDLIEDDTVYQYRRYYVRENKSNVCPTLKVNMAGGGHNVPIILDTKNSRRLILKFQKSLLNLNKLAA